MTFSVVVKMELPLMVPIVMKREGGRGLSLVRREWRMVVGWDWGNRVVGLIGGGEWWCTVEAWWRW